MFTSQNFAVEKRVELESNLFADLDIPSEKLFFNDLRASESPTLASCTFSARLNMATGLFGRRKLILCFGFIHKC